MANFMLKYIGSLEIVPLRYQI